MGTSARGWEHPWNLPTHSGATVCPCPSARDILTEDNVAVGGEAAEADSQKNSAPAGARKWAPGEAGGARGPRTAGGAGTPRALKAGITPTHRAPTMSGCPCIPEQSGLEGALLRPTRPAPSPGMGRAPPCLYLPNAAPTPAPPPHTREPTGARTSPHEPSRACTGQNASGARPQVRCIMASRAAVMACSWAQTAPFTLR